jgi:dienelactone hydrolase
VRPLLALVLLPGVLAGCGGGSEHAAAASSDPYAYDRSAPLDLRDRGVVRRVRRARVRDLLYASPRGGRVSAYLVVPRRSGRHPAVIFLHGAGGDRTQLLELATRVAQRGAVALTVDSPFAGARNAGGPTGLAGLRRMRDLFEQEVIDLRRAVDVLQSLPFVDPGRLAFLGWSAGARSGAIFAAVEPRVRSFVLIGGGARPLAEYLAYVPQDVRSEVRRLLSPVDPLRWIGRARPGTLFFQNGLADEIVPREALTALIDAAPSPRRVRWYAAGHVPTARMREDAIAWLSRRLRLPSAPGS